jgi:hypothetical protein
MVADDLAISLAEQYVRPGHSILDPFCGSGRLLAAAARKPVFCVGTDLNPLACLLTRAKLFKPDLEVVRRVARELNSARQRPPTATFQVRGPWKVEWFTPEVVVELGQIVSSINELNLGAPEKLLAAAALSAAARDASFARNGNWKLHRISAEERRRFSRSAWDCFERRLQYCISRAAIDPLLATGAEVAVGSALNLTDSSSLATRFGPFDILITSPPYGDSRTTVQYGAASGLSLGWVSQIHGLEKFMSYGRDIDAGCLGGKADRFSADMSAARLACYWRGCSDSVEARRVEAFLGDFGHACKEIASCVKLGGTAILIVGRRSTGGSRLKLDRFAVDCLEGCGFQLTSIELRRLRGKHLPRQINRFARSRSPRAGSRVGTISHEIILVLKKVGLRKWRNRVVAPPS